jgi:nitrogen regulatory protein P-II 1
MFLLVVIVNEEEKIEALLSGFLDLGVTGATLIRSEGMGRVLSQDEPVFAGLQTLMARSRPRNTTILSVIETQEVLDRAIEAAQRACGDFNSPGTGILFTIKLDRTVGLAPGLDLGRGSTPAEPG